MFVGIDDPGHKALVRAYRNTAQKLEDVNVGAHLLEAADLLDQSTFTPVRLLSEVQGDLRLDALDLERRGDFLIEVDAAVAFRLQETTGALLNSNLAQKALDNGWTYREAELRAELDALRRLSKDEQARRGNQIRQLEAHLKLLVPGGQPATPDAGGSLTTERRARFVSPEGTSAASGLGAIVSALDHTADPSRIANDEFEIVHLDTGKVLLILPGVADLSETLGATTGLIGAATPYTRHNAIGEVANAVGWNEDHHSARDTWIAARASAHSAAVEDNRYAQLVRDYVANAVDHGIIKDGSELMIVGHSYGADTAVDLAADPNFNGSLVSVTHVVAAAYHNEPQLQYVPSETQVTVVQNLKDLVVLAESKLEGDAYASQQFNAALSQMPVNTVIAAANLTTEGIAEIGEATAEVVTNTMKEMANAVGPGNESVNYANFEFDAPDIPRLTAAERVIQVNDNIVLAEFDGGFGDAGHHQDHYTNYLQQTSEASLRDFFEDVAKSGYTGEGLAWAVDVTVPEEMR